MLVATSDQHRVHSADEQFAAGRLQATEKICRELWEDNYRSPMLTALLADLLLRNRNTEAEPPLQRAISEQGGNPRPIHALAECHRRSDHLREAADLYRKLGRVECTNKLERLADGGWYLLPEGAAADVPWAAHADLPLVEARVNGVEGHFLLDTGVGETLIDPALARSGQVATLGGEPIHFPSGPAGQVEHAVIDALTLGTLSIAQVPAQVHATREAFAGLLPFPVDGILGTGFGISSEMQARPLLCRSLSAAGVERCNLPGMLMGHFRLEQQFGFHIGGLLGDGFVNTGALTMDFETMRLTLRV